MSDAKAESARKMTEERLKEFSDAWDRADLDGVMAFFTDDCVFQPSVEYSPGYQFTGRAAVAEEIRRIFARDGGLKSSSGIHVVFGDCGYCEWSLITHLDGKQAEIRGCDFFRFEGDRICRKDAFRKATLWLKEQQ